MRIAIVVLQVVGQEFPACSHPRSKDACGSRASRTTHVHTKRACAVVWLIGLAYLTGFATTVILQLVPLKINVH